MKKNFDKNFKLQKRYWEINKDKNHGKFETETRITTFIMGFLIKMWIEFELNKHLNCAAWNVWIVNWDKKYLPFYYFAIVLLFNDYFVTYIECDIKPMNYNNLHSNT